MVLSTSYLYILNVWGTQYYKIGITRNIRKRYAQIDATNPHKLKIVLLFELENAQEYETKLHHRYKKNKIKYEWYTLEANDLYKIHKLLPRGSNIASTHYRCWYGCTCQLFTVEKDQYCTAHNLLMYDY